MLKAKTVEQFKIIEWLDANFEIEEILMELLDRNTVAIMDKTGGTAQIKYANGKIELEEME